MASITLKNIPDGLLSRLRERAEGNRRSLMQEALVLLERGARERPDPWSGRAAESTPGYGTDAAPGGADGAVEVRARQVEAWRELCGRWESAESVDDELEAIYGARTGGREVDL